MDRITHTRPHYTHVRKYETTLLTFKSNHIGNKTRREYINPCINNSKVSTVIGSAPFHSAHAQESSHQTRIQLECPNGL